MTSTARPADVLLRDGSVASIRPARTTDASALDDLHDRVGQESLRLRFFSASRVTARTYVEHLTRSPDVLVLVAERDGRIEAVATAEPLDVTTSEVSFLVGDTCHGLGLGSLLLEHLAAAGRQRGIHRFVAEVLAENRAMLDVLTDAGFAFVRRTESGCVHVEMDTGVSWEALRSADERERRAEASSLCPLLYPRSVAIVGVRRDGTGIGAAVLRSILAGGFTGSVSVVHPNASELNGLPTVPTVRDLPGPVDLLVVAVPAVAVVGVLEDAAAAGVRAVAVLSSGFAELGHQGANLEDQMLRIARRNSIRMVGPNCLGLLSNHPDIRLDATFSGLVPPYGGLAIASQSGGVGIVVEEAARRIGLGVLGLVSLGNKLDVSSNDLLAAWQEDPKVTAAALYLESFGNARKFARVAREFSEVKPLLAVVGGRSSGGRRAGASHTAAAATPGLGVRALFTQAGVIGCDGAEDLAETALLLAEQPLPQGHRVAVLSNAGGLGVLAADVAEEQGLVVPELSQDLRTRLARHVSGTVGTGNPVDAGADVDPDDLAALAHLLLASDEVDALVVLLVRTAVSDTGAAAHLLPDVHRRHPDKPVVLVPFGGLLPDAEETLGVTRFGSAQAALRALARASRYAAWRRAPHEPDIPADRVTGEKARALAIRSLADRPKGAWLDTDAVADLLRGHGLAPDGEVVRGAEAATDAARRVGYPVVLKVAAGDVVHRTERALVRVGVDSDEAVRRTIEEFENEIGDAVPVLVQPVLTGTEVALGLVRDPAFGPLAMVAAGGIYTDVWDDRAFLLPPISRRDAERAVRSLRISAMLAGQRGSAAADVGSLVALLMQLGHLAEDVPEIAELDLNPVLVTPQGCVVVDAKVRIDPGPVVDAGVPRRLRDRPSR